MKSLNYLKMQTHKVKEIKVWTDDKKTRICLGKIGFWFFIKAIKTWIFNTCLEIEGKTIMCKLPYDK